MFATNLFIVPYVDPLTAFEPLLGGDQNDAAIIRKRVESKNSHSNSDSAVFLATDFG